MAKFAAENGVDFPAGDMGSLAPTQTFGGATSKTQSASQMLKEGDESGVPQWVAYDRQAGGRPAARGLPLGRFDWA